MANDLVLSLSDVTKDYAGTRALDGISLDIERGAFVALVGASGSGKTTLLKVVNRLVEPDSGTVTLDGFDTAQMEAHALRRRIGYVFQQIGLFPHLGVAENIWLLPGLTGRGTGERDARVVELLDLVSLPRDFASRLPGELSGGQAQRVGVARALAADPEIVLMDEPFGALDPVTRQDLGEAYRALHDRLGLTTVMVTHDIAEALLLATRIVVLEAGRIVADGTPRELAARGVDGPAARMMAVPLEQAQRLAELRGPA